MRSFTRLSLASVIISVVTLLPHHEALSEVSSSGSGSSCTRSAGSEPKPEDGRKIESPVNVALEVQRSLLSATRFRRFFRGLAEHMHQLSEARLPAREQLAYVRVKDLMADIKESNKNQAIARAKKIRLDFEANLILMKLVGEAISEYRKISQNGDSGVIDATKKKELEARAKILSSLNTEEISVPKVWIRRFWRALSQQHSVDGLSDLYNLWRDLLVRYQDGYPVYERYSMEMADLLAAGELADKVILYLNTASAGVSTDMKPPSDRDLDRLFEAAGNLGFSVQLVAMEQVVNKIRPQRSTEEDGAIESKEYSSTILSQALNALSEISGAGAIGKEVLDGSSIIALSPGDKLVAIKQDHPQFFKLLQTPPRISSMQKLVRDLSNDAQRGVELWKTFWSETRDFFAWTVVTRFALDRLRHLYDKLPDVPQDTKLHGHVPDRYKAEKDYAQGSDQSSGSSVSAREVEKFTKEMVKSYGLSVQALGLLKKFIGWFISDVADYASIKHLLPRVTALEREYFSSMKLMSKNVHTNYEENQKVAMASYMTKLFEYSSRSAHMFGNNPDHLLITFARIEAYRHWVDDFLEYLDSGLLSQTNRNRLERIRDIAEIRGRMGSSLSASFMRVRSSARNLALTLVTLGTLGGAYVLAKPGPEVAEVPQNPPAVEQSVGQDAAAQAEGNMQSIIRTLSKLGAWVGLPLGDDKKPPAHPKKPDSPQDQQQDPPREDGGEAPPPEEGETP